MYKLAVSDIDGTLVDNSGKLSIKTIETIKKAEKSGLIFTLCTGRNIHKTLPVAKALALKVPFVCIDGILLFDPVAKKPVHDKSLPAEHVEHLLELGNKNNMYMEVSDGYRYYKYIPDKEHEKYDFFNKHTFFGHIKSFAGGIRYFDKPDKFFKIKSSIYQVVLADEIEKAEKVARAIRESGIDDIEVRDFIWDGYLFINRSGMGKARGIKMLCEHFGVSPDEVMAFGDENNDIDMLAMAGMGIAVENAVEKAKEVSNYITLSNENDGVAAALKELYLKG